jgi:hypothetical protein
LPISLVSRHVIWSAAVLFILSLEGPPLFRLPRYAQVSACNLASRSSAAAKVDSFLQKVKRT